jgi:hypothetical protein
VITREDIQNIVAQPIPIEVMARVTDEILAKAIELGFLVVAKVDTDETQTAYRFTGLGIKMLTGLVSYSADTFSTPIERMVMNQALQVCIPQMGVIVNLESVGLTVDDLREALSQEDGGDK